jgi:hypothetical protein
MRILMACAAFPPFIDGGGPISALMVAKLLQQSGHDLEVVNVADRKEREVYEGVPVQRLSPGNARSGICWRTSTRVRLSRCGARSAGSGPTSS